MALLPRWADIVAVCAKARWVGLRADTADKELSRRQWELMCEALGLDDLSAADPHADQLSTPLAGAQPGASGPRDDPDPDSGDAPALPRTGPGVSLCLLR